MGYPQDSLVDVSSSIQAADPRVRVALRLIADVPERTDVAKISIGVNLAPSYFRRLFKKEIGISPNRALKIARLVKAKKLLESSCLSVKEIAVVVGLPDFSHFDRDYKKQFGETPRCTRSQGLGQDCHQRSTGASAPAK